jgi:hypothetical protein
MSSHRPYFSIIHANGVIPATKTKNIASLRSAPNHALAKGANPFRDTFVLEVHKGFAEWATDEAAAFFDEVAKI